MKKILLLISIILLTFKPNSQANGLLALTNNLQDNATIFSEGSTNVDGDESMAWQHIKSGQQFDQSSDMESAIKEYGLAIGLDNGIAEAYDYRAVCYIKLGKYRKALSDLEDAIDINSGFVDAYNHLGVASYWLKNYQDAINFYSRAISLNPAYATPYFNRAIVYLALDENQLALNDLNKAKELKLDGVDPVLQEFFADKQ
jgi:tetratricopeptide (TPR) repeat protein